MATYIDCDRYGFFNGILGIEQSNWANFWKGIIPDGVIANQGDELEVYAQSDGKKVHIRTGQAIVAGHRAWVNVEKEIDIADNTSGANRTDGIMLRVTYGNSGESQIQIVAKTGSISPTRTIGGTYELLLASVTVGDGFVTIPASAVTDRRYIFKMAMDAAAGFSGTSVTPLNDREFRNNNAIASLTINLPANPHATFITGVCFRSAASGFGGVTFKKGTASVTPKMCGDTLNLNNKKYNLVIWWDGAYYWCAAKAGAL